MCIYGALKRRPYNFANEILTERKMGKKSIIAIRNTLGVDYFGRARVCVIWASSLCRQCSGLIAPARGTPGVKAARAPVYMCSARTGTRVFVPTYRRAARER